MTVSISHAGNIAVVTIDNPPVNATSHNVRQGLWDALDKTASDDAIEAVVLCCAGRTFIAGADVKEFGLPPRDPSLPELLHRIEAAPKLWIAAIHGNALGGGLETGMACHFRIATADAKLGLPEVTLGLIPGAGGTVRLPRLVPSDHAMQMIGGGRPISGTKARKTGLVDRLSQDDLLQDAIAFAKDLSRQAEPKPVSNRPIVPESSPDAFEQAAAAVLKKAKGQHAPAAAVAAVRRAIDAPVEDAFRTERTTFGELRDGDQSKALRHIFFAECSTTRIDRIKGITARPIHQTGVIGGGTMGAGIAASMLLSKRQVTMIERDDAAAQAGADRVHKILEKSKTRGILSDQNHADALRRFKVRTDYVSLSQADLVVEAVFEDMDVKAHVLKTLDDVVGLESVLATNTSYLDVNALAAQTRHPERVIGLHFFSPAHIMKLLEVVVPNSVSETTLATSVTFAKSLGKIPVLSGVCEGFIANRIMSAYRQKAEFLIEDGAMPWDVDQAMRAYGFPMGIFEMQDLAGLDIAWAKRKRLAKTRDPNERYVEIADKLCEANHFGRKTGQGYYRYNEGKSFPSSDTEALILAESDKKGIIRRPFSEKEIMDIILDSIRREANDILLEGIAYSEDDIDVVMINAFGYPRHTGGPMFSNPGQPV